MVVVFFDLSKAFDTVLYRLLLAALQFNCIEGPILCWFQNYLSGHSQIVVLDRCASDPHAVTSGVLQGSIGPLFFIIFMNSIFNISLSHGSNIMVYADDIVLNITITTDFNLSALPSVGSWAKMNSVEINIMKTKAVNFLRKYHTPS